MNFAELDPDERRVLAGLVRLMVRMDGVLSAAEVQAVSALGRDIGATSFWSDLNEASDLDVTNLGPLVGKVRDEVRDWMYGTLVGLAAVDGIDDAESSLLAWLMDVWSLHD